MFELTKSEYHDILDISQQSTQKSQFREIIKGLHSDINPACEHSELLTRALLIARSRYPELPTEDASNVIQNIHERKSKAYSPVDTKYRKRVGRHGELLVKKSLERQKWSVIDRTKDNCGYDLECTRSGEIKLVEVKTISSSYPTITITPNEMLTAGKAFLAEVPYYVFIVKDPWRKPKVFEYPNPTARYFVTPEIINIPDIKSFDPLR